MYVLLPCLLTHFLCVCVWVGVYVCALVQEAGHTACQPITALLISRSGIASCATHMSAIGDRVGFAVKIRETKKRKKEKEEEGHRSPH